MIGDVRNNIGGETVGADKHKILIGAERRCLEPNGPLGFVSVPFFLEKLNHFIDGTIGVESGLLEPPVVVDTVLSKVSLQVCDVDGERVLD